MKTPKDNYPTLQAIPSSRTYALYFSYSDGKPAVHSIQDILNFSMSHDDEWAHSLTDRLDEVLDLKVAESMFFYPNRDDKNSRREHAIIKRTR